jgi:hypothetical protein
MKMILVHLAIQLACATLAYGQATPDGAPPGWHAAYDAAQAKFLSCVQFLRSPQWAEFTEPPPGNGAAYNAWA